MSKRNFILLIIILTITLVVALGFLYVSRSPSTPGEEEGGTNFLSEFNPFGPSTPTTSPNNTPTNTDPANGEQGTGEIPTETSRLTKVSSMPIAGFTVYQKERFKEVPVVVPEVVETAGTTTETEAKTTTTSKPTPPPTEFAPSLRYVARTSGNIYQTFADKIEERKFSMTVVPKVYEAYFGNKGESVIMRYLKADDKTIATFAGTMEKELLGGDSSEDNEVTGVFLPDNVSDVSVSPDYTKIFYLLNVGESVVGITSGLSGEKKVQVFDSPFTEWLSFWPNSKMITLTTKPSASVPGYMYAVDPNKKDLKKILGNINGLTTLGSPDGKSVLYGNNNLSLSIYNIGTGENTLLPVRTLPEKCIWNKINTIIYCSAPKSIPPGIYPDSWYQGEVSFSDDIWKIDIQSGTASIILEGEELDGIKFALNESENYLFFVNKKDSYLWELKLD